MSKPTATAKPRAATKAPWEVAIEQMAKTVADIIAKANAEAKARAKEAAAEAKARAKEAAAEAKARAAEADKRAEARAAEADKRAEARAAEADKRAKEAEAAANKRAAEFAAEAKARAEQAAAEAKARAAEADKRAEARDKKAAEETAELRRIMGIYTTDEGEFLEHDVAAAIIDAMELDGVKFDRIITNSHVHDEKLGDGEFDWIGINGKVVFVGETRRTLGRRDVRRFTNNRMELFRRAFPHHTEGKEVQAVLIYQKAKAGAVEEALKLKVKVFRAEDAKTLRPVKTPADITKRTQTQTHKRQKSATS